MKKIIPLSLIGIVAVILVACGSASPLRDGGAGYAPEPDYAFDVAPSVQNYGGEAPLPMSEEFAVPNNGSSDVRVSASGQGGGGNAAQIERLVIQNANITIVVSDVDSRMNDIMLMAEKMGGFVVSSNRYESSTYQGLTNTYIEVPEGQVQIRVPAEKLDEALDQIKKDVVNVQNETRSGQDVTAEYVDLKSRLVNLQAAEEQLNKIMQDATDTEDVVNIFNQLVYYREQIELVKGQMKYYEEAAALSSINVTIIAEEKDQPIQIGKWEPKGVAKEAIQDLIFFYQDFVDFVIRFVIYTLPVWITVGIPLYFIFIGIRALFRKMRGNRKPKPEPVVDTKVEEVKDEKKKGKKK